MPHIAHAVQELTGLELSALIEDPEHASVEVIAAEALARSGSATRESRAAARAEPTWARWVAPAPFTVKMRLFCLPYAGGVSENVFARCALSAHSRALQSLRQAVVQQELARWWRRAYI